MSKATVTTKSGRFSLKGRERTLILKQGGKVLGRACYWSWSAVSEEQAVKFIKEIADKNGVTQLVWAENKSQL